MSSTAYKYSEEGPVEASCDDSDSSANPAYPEGGWGWVVVAGSFFLQVLTIGITYTFGILLVVLKKPEPDGFGAPESEAAWIGSIQPCLLYLTGLVSGELINRFGSRPVTMIGSIISCVGYLTSSFAPNVYVLYVTYGVATGIGNGLMYLTSMVTVQHYFDKRRSLATGLAVSGSGVGMLVFGFLTQYLLDTIGWRNTLRVEAATMLLGLLCGAVFRPLPPLPGDLDDEQALCINQDPGHNGSLEVEEESQRSCHCTGCSFVDLSLFKDPVFICFCLAVVMFCFGYHVPYTYTPDRAIAMGQENNRAAFLVCIMGISNVSGRLLFGWIGDVNESARFYMGGIMLTLGGVVSCAISLFNTYTTMAVYSALFGLFTGCWVSLFPVIMGDVMGVDVIEKSLGQCLATASIAFLVASPMSGWIIAKTGSYDTPYWVVGSAEVIGGVIFFCMRLLQRSRRQADYEPIEERPRTRSRRDSRRSFIESFS